MRNRDKKEEEGGGVEEEARGYREVGSQNYQKRRCLAHRYHRQNRLREAK